MPESMASSSTADARFTGCSRKRLPHPKARIDTCTPVRPSVLCGSVGGAAAPAASRSDRSTGTPTTAPVTTAPAATAMPLRSRNSRRLTPPFVAMFASDPSLTQL